MSRVRRSVWSEACGSLQSALPSCVCCESPGPQSHRGVSGRSGRAVHSGASQPSCLPGLVSSLLSPSSPAEIKVPVGGGEPLLRRLRHCVETTASHPTQGCLVPVLAALLLVQPLCCTPWEADNGASPWVPADHGETWAESRGAGFHQASPWLL